MDTEWGGKERAALNALRARSSALPWREGHDGNLRIYAADGEEDRSGPLATVLRRADLSTIVALVNAAPHVEAALGEMEQALAKYGQHERSCKALRLSHCVDVGEYVAYGPTHCDCGLSAVLAKYALPAKREESAT